VCFNKNFYLDVSECAIFSQYSVLCIVLAFVRMRFSSRCSVPLFMCIAILCLFFSNTTSMACSDQARWVALFTYSTYCCLFQASVLWHVSSQFFSWLAHFFRSHFLISHHSHYVILWFLMSLAFLLHTRPKRQNCVIIYWNSWNNAFSAVKIYSSWSLLSYGLRHVHYSLDAIVLISWLYLYLYCQIRLNRSYLFYIW